VVTEFSNGVTPMSMPAFITAGADGNMWFTQEGSGEIGRITTAGVVSEFKVPGMTPDPDGIAAGPDGNVWFSVRWQNAIGRIMPDGTITTFTAGITPGSLPTGITAGSDGNLWFTEVAGDRIGRISPGPAVTPSQGPASVQGTVGDPRSGGRGCPTRGGLRFHLHHRRGEPILRVEVRVGKHVIRVRRGRDVRTVSLPEPAARRFTVRITTTDSRGRRRTTVRTYDGCAKGRPRRERRARSSR